ncbi:vacuole membrane protein KMS1-like isoform X1 [Actinidia eriantha]|uniref:vacuole membrane protein KMS1-like isoform X1 n=2 Tax=Actinidia eriantha TaxID=165200 RepID=UPI002591255E|nr:vacuole membrane protein KMS1-like isoform X1 [Actinidia eriantha]
MGLAWGPETANKFSLCYLHRPSSAHSQLHVDSSISGLHEKHLRELENLTLATQPLKTLKYFVLAVFQFLQQPLFGTSEKCGWLMVTSILAGSIGIMVTTVGRPHVEHVQELLCYLRFGIWWLALGVVSSIGLGSGLHTFVLYLGPHIALFTIKSVHCGRVDLKIGPYDTIQLKTGPSWVDRDCSEFGPPLYAFPDSRVPLSSILPQVQLEVILWGIGTALGELPPYFISRAAYKSDSKTAVVEDLDSSLKEDAGGIIANHLKQLKQWLLSHSQHLNFFTILALASVPNPLFDLAGIMCGQLGIPFWKFFSATLIGKAIIKTHIQTVFIILLCNNQLLDFVENELIWVLSLVPGLDSILPNVIAKLHIVKEKYMTSTPPASSNMKVKKWDLSFASVWNTVVWLVLMNSFMKIVTATAQSFLKEQQEKELASLKEGAPTTSMPTICSNSEVLD